MKGQPRATPPTTAACRRQVWDDCRHAALGGGGGGGAAGVEAGYIMGRVYVGGETRTKGQRNAVYEQGETGDMMKPRRRQMMGGEKKGRIRLGWDEGEGGHKRRGEERVDKDGRG